MRLPEDPIEDQRQSDVHKKRGRYGQNQDHETNSCHRGGLRDGTRAFIFQGVRRAEFRTTDRASLRRLSRCSTPAYRLRATI